MGPQTYRIGKAISPFLSDRVTNTNCLTGAGCCIALNYIEGQKNCKFQQVE